jgi:hypothetical protein
LILNFSVVEVNTEKKFVCVYGFFAVAASIIGAIFFMYVLSFFFLADVVA